MPYLVALSVSVLVAALVRPWLHDDDAVPGAPGMGQLLAHGLLLQDLLGYDALSTGVWYVAIDFQLFVLAMAAIGVSDILQRRWALGAERARGWMGAVVVALVIASLVVFNREEQLDITAIYFFGSYGLGMLVFWIGQADRSRLWRPALLMLVLIGAAALALDWRSRIAIALATAVALAILQHLDALGPRTWPALGRPLVRIGRISYSLFLIHFPVLLLVSALAIRFLPDAPWIDLFGLLLTLVLSIAAAALLHRWVETRPVTWRAVLGLFAGLLACGALVL
jgi:peptidoglycan/LPS O-acetylase OafA/YrhL